MALLQLVLVFSCFLLVLLPFFKFFCFFWVFFLGPPGAVKGRIQFHKSELATSCLVVGCFRCLSKSCDFARGRIQRHSILLMYIELFLYMT